MPQPYTLPIKDFLGKTILIADDEPILREILRDELELHGAQVLEAANGKEGLRLLQNHPCDLVISDIRMPGGDGIEFIKNSKIQLPFLPVFIFISGYTDLTTMTAYDLGAESLLLKPFDLETLVEKVKFLLQPMEKRFESKPVTNLSDATIIEKTFVDLNHAIKDGWLSLGRGGMFLRHESPIKSSTCTFRLSFEMGDFRLLEGTGSVCWSRTEPDGDLPSGIGITFQFLPEDSRKRLIQVIQEIRPAAYLPKK